MLVCRYPGLFIQVHPVGREKKYLYHFEMKKINPYLLNLILKFFTPLHFVCLLLLQCAHYNVRYEFSLL